MIRIGIIGAAGLSGRELLYWLKFHPEASVELVTSSKYRGKQVSEVFPELSGYSQIFEQTRVTFPFVILFFSQYLIMQA